MISTTTLPSLSPEELSRYRRHLVLPELGVEGQRRLKGGRVLLVGAGGLGSPAALYLAAAGVGRLTVVDPDAVDATNLQRQVLYGTPDVGRPKVECAADRLRGLNPHVEVVGLPVRFDRDNALALAAEHDLVVDGADNFATRYLVNDACVLAGRPNVHASILRFEGQATVFAAPGGPCYRCLYPRPPAPGAVPSCAEGGVLGVLPGLLGVIQATEALKLLAGVGEPLVGRLLLVDALSMSFRTVRLRRDPACPACGTRTLRALDDYDALCGSPAAHATARLAPRELAACLGAAAPPQVIDVREPDEWARGHLPGSLHLPLASLPASAAALDPAREVIIVCRSGVRSLYAAEVLEGAGFARVRDLAGGLLAWKAEIDPALDVA